MLNYFRPTHSSMTFQIVKNFDSNRNAVCFDLKFLKQEQYYTCVCPKSIFFLYLWIHPLLMERLMTT